MELEPKALSGILTDHFSRYPAMQVRDLYKLLFQAALGSEHAILEDASARRWLLEELETLGPGPDEPLIDPISPDGEIVRVHLRPYLAAGRDPQALLKAFLRTADAWHGSRERLRGFGAAAAQSLEAQTGPCEGGAVGSFFATMEAQAFPAVHHSEEYTRLYRPAYRVVARSLLETA